MWIFVFFYVVFSILSKGVPGIYITLFQYIIPLINNWYTWIIRVFFIIALVAPLVTQYVKEISVNKYLSLLIVALILFEGLCRLSTHWFYIILIMNIPYIIVFSLGIMIHRINKNQLLIIMMIAFALYFILSFLICYKNGHFIITGKYKYPPRLYYTSYAIGAIILLFYNRKQIHTFFHLCKIDKICAFIGSHTLWIYFYHIFLLDIIDDKFQWASRYAIVYVFSILFVINQDILIQHIVTNIKNENIKNNIMIIFKG